MQAEIYESYPTSNTQGDTHNTETANTYPNNELSNTGKRKLNNSKASLQAKRMKLLLQEVLGLQAQFCSMRTQMNSISQDIKRHNDFSSITTVQISIDAKSAVQEITTLRKLCRPRKLNYICTSDTED